MQKIYTIWRETRVYQRVTNIEANASSW